MGGVLRTRILPNVAALAMKPHFVRRLAFLTLSQIGIEYRASSLSHTGAGVAKKAPAAGDRFPWLQLTFADDSRREDLFERLDDTKFNLLVIGQPAPPTDRLELGDLLATHVVPLEGENARVLAAVSITAPACYLLRPDGHIGLAATTFDEAELIRWFSSCRLNLGRADRQDTGTPCN